MSPTSSVPCASDDFFLLRLLFIYFFHRTSHICSMMSLTNLGLTPDPLARTFFCTLSLCFDESAGSVSFGGLTFFSNRSLLQR